MDNTKVNYEEETFEESETTTSNMDDIKEDKAGEDINIKKAVDDILESLKKEYQEIKEQQKNKQTKDSKRPFKIGICGVLTVAIIAKAVTSSIYYLTKDKK